MYLTARMVIVMRINTFFYSIKQGFKNIFRNKMFSLASIATMAACIFMFGLFYIVVTNFSSMVKTAEEGVAVTVFFNEGTTEDVIKADKAQIEKRAEVGKVDYQSALMHGVITRRSISRAMTMLQLPLVMITPSVIQQICRFI